jgi:hypothetical protein
LAGKSRVLFSLFAMPKYCASYNALRVFVFLFTCKEGTSCSLARLIAAAAAASLLPATLQLPAAWQA